MVGVLACVKELVEYAREQDLSFCAPYVIEDDRIGGISICLRYNQPESWTRACRYLLFTLRALLAWTLERAASP